ncbi:FSH1-domain-containing protein [Aspergillus heteromorphus CBS 117.55]|uniref:FSH1-domain-containing protein n=1 Tax=Aspergillus heteromorphus CBS 117.55 TaxID=1448321 RepID=A0A317WDF6_9EURO|nr:FSH1-domain-containing protein [Aspergillus heteromorphus CBS 117.55]PWY82220.1 FSH1-domain-containing protein [Aspergillus heteromorphus CBS 117.55]
MPPLKILCLHGYTQSGPLFHAKSRALIKHLTKALSPTHAVTTVYPTGPIQLLPSDIPGYEPPSTSTSTTSTSTSTEGGSTDDDTSTEAYGWFRRSDTTNPPLYSGLETGLSSIAQVLKNEGPFDAVIGFSQGAAMAALIASLLEPGRAETMTRFRDPAVACQGSEFSGVPGFQVPEVWDEVWRVQPALKFAVCYSGFRAPGPRYRGFYEPGVRTPVLHVLGTLDAVVEEARSRALVEACLGSGDDDGRVVFHPGGHFVPSQRPYLDAVVGFVRGVLADEEGAGKNGKGKGVMEEDVNDMDLPF